MRAEAERHAWQRPEEATALARLPAYNLIAENLHRLSEDAAATEDAALLTLYHRDGATTNEPFAPERLGTEMHQLLRQLLDLRYAESHRITLAVFGENRRSLFELTRAYHAAALIAEMHIKMAYYSPDPPPELKEVNRTHGKRAPSAEAHPSASETLADDEQAQTRRMFGRQVMRREAADAVKFLAAAPDAVGIVCELAGPSAHAAYEGERGLHAFPEAKATQHLLVHTSDAHFAKYQPPPSLEQRGAISHGGIAHGGIAHGERRRTYQRTAGYVEDHALSVKREWESAKTDGAFSLAATLKFLIDAHVARAAEALIDE
ncbi:MAG: hypothetical protein WKF30_04555 [Pyrinomonadaceae bacterium]